MSYGNNSCSISGLPGWSICSPTPLLWTCRNLVVMFACHHCVCPDCFQQYCRETLITRRFEQDPNVGYTIKCPGKVGVQVGTLCKKGCYTLCITLISSVLHMCNSAYGDVISNIAYYVSIHTVIQYRIATLNTQWWVWCIYFLIPKIFSSNS